MVFSTSLTSFYLYNCCKYQFVNYSPLSNTPIRRISLCSTTAHIRFSALITIFIYITTKYTSLFPYQKLNSIRPLLFICWDLARKFKVVRPRTAFLPNPSRIPFVPFALFSICRNHPIALLFIDQPLPSASSDMATRQSRQTRILAFHMAHSLLTNSHLVATVTDIRNALLISRPSTHSQ